ncbi:MAG: PaaI family thioesterase [Chloroflexota bacterium]|nr:PaaI family thioesterase [Chloroflexota bacterium]MDE2894758.1 PaaI family thioesterase [Chloroflexota bacterium]
MDQWPRNESRQGLAEWINQQSSEETLMDRLGMRVTEAGPERVVVELPVHPGVFTPQRHVHAGAMIALADTAATWAAMASYRSELEPDQLPVAVAISSQLVANVSQGLLIAEATVPHPGRTLLAATTRITNGDGKLLALVNSTHFVRAPSQPVPTHSA